MFFLLPFRIGNVRRGELPIANGAIVGLNVVLYVLAECGGWRLGTGRGASVLTIVTYAFAHANVSHLLLNVWFLWLFGNPVNRRLGNAYYLLVYFVSTIALGTFCWLFSSGYCLGASGVLFAVLLLFMTLMPAAQVRVALVAIVPLTLIVGLLSLPKHWTGWIVRWGVTTIRARTGLLFVPLLELWGLFWTGWNWTNLAHLLGLLCGVAALLLLPRRIATPGFAPSTPTP